MADGASVELTDDAIDRITRSRQVVDDAIDRGEAIYGVTTGVGTRTTNAFRPMRPVRYWRCCWRCTSGRWDRCCRPSASMPGWSHG